VEKGDGTGLDIGFKRKDKSGTENPTLGEKSVGSRGDSW